MSSLWEDVFMRLCYLCWAWMGLGPLVWARIFVYFNQCCFIYWLREYFHMVKGFFFGFGSALFRAVIELSISVLWFHASPYCFPVGLGVPWVWECSFPGGSGSLRCVFGPGLGVFSGARVWVAYACFCAWPYFWRLSFGYFSALFTRLYFLVAGAAVRNRKVSFI